MNLDVEARQLAKQFLDRAQRGETESYGLLKAAQKANVDFATNQSSAAAARRAQLARRAYETRVNAELSRTMAAYALLAEREGTRALTARETLKRVQDAKRKETLVEEAKGGSMRRSIMMQAMQATAKALDAAPGLPESVVGMMPGPSQATVGLTDEFRAPEYISRAGAFFPLDVRAAAGSLKGLAQGTDWDSTLLDRISEDTAAVVKRAHELAAEVMKQEPGTSGMTDEAKSLTDTLKLRHDAEARGVAGFPWLHVVGGGAALYLLWKVLR